MITVSRIKKMESGNVIAYFDVTINGVEVKGLKLVKSPKDNSIFISFPSEKGKDDKYYNTVFIPDVVLKKEVEDVLKETYNKIKDSDSDKEEIPY
jgi:DNA-binding cell septation regulator SpoVG